MVRRQCDHGKFKYKMHVCSSVLTGGQRLALVAQHRERNPVVCDASPPARRGLCPTSGPCSQESGCRRSDQGQLPPLLCSFCFYCTIWTVLQLTLKRGYEILHFPKWTRSLRV